MVGTQCGLPQRQRLLAEREGLVVPAQTQVAGGQVVHARQRVRVVGAQLGLPQRQRMLVELEGLGEPAQAQVAAGQDIHAPERVGVVKTAVLEVERAGLLELLCRDWCLAQVIERCSKSVPQPGLDEGLVGEALATKGKAVSRALRSVTSLPKPPACPSGRAAANILFSTNSSTDLISPSRFCAASFAFFSCWAAARAAASALLAASFAFFKVGSRESGHLSALPGLLARR